MASFLKTKQKSLVREFIILSIYVYVKRLARKY